MPPLALPSRGRYNSAPRGSQQLRTKQESAMGEPSPGAPSERPPEDRLDSWKEIAAYLERDVTTVQRWEKREGMPVHRHLHDKMGSIYAFRLELDTWARSRNFKGNQEIASLTVSHEPVISPEPVIPQSSNRRDSFL